MFRTLTRSDKEESKKLYILDFRRQKDVYYREAKAKASLIICVHGLKYANKTVFAAQMLQCLSHGENNILSTVFLYQPYSIRNPHMICPAQTI